MNTTTTTEQWISAIKSGETSLLQFKQAYTGQKALATEMIAFANSKGGTILFGVEDKTGQIVGLTYDEIQTLSREAGNTANEQIRPTLYIQTEAINIDGKLLLAIHIEEGICKPYKDLNNNIWVKQGADKRRITENSEILRLFSSSRVYNPDEEAVLGSSLDDLDESKIEKYLMKVYGKTREEFDVDYHQLLNNLRITDKTSHLTLAGLLYFGKRPQQFKPAFCIKAVAFFGNDMGGTKYRDSKDMEGTIPELYDQAMHFLDLNLHHIQGNQSFNSLGQLEVSKIALEEILQNALCHREYIKQAPIRLLIFDNRIEIISPGCLPDGLSVDEIKLGNTVQRNTLIATFCSRTMLYRGLGTGIIRALKEDSGIKFINDEQGNMFTAIIERKNQNVPKDIVNVPENVPKYDVNVPENVPKDGVNVPEEILCKLKDRQISILRMIMTNPIITVVQLASKLGVSDKTIKRDIQEIRSLGFYIERVAANGKSKWIINFE